MDKETNKTLSSLTKKYTKLISKEKDFVQQKERVTISNFDSHLLHMRAFLEDSRRANSTNDTKMISEVSSLKDNLTERKLKSLNKHEEVRGLKGKLAKIVKSNASNSNKETMNTMRSVYGLNTGRTPFTPFRTPR